jgi:hypothetical protein
MALKITAGFQTSGEHIVVEAAQVVDPSYGTLEPVSVIMQQFEQGMQTADMRAGEANMRMLEAYNFRQFFDPVTWQKVTWLLSIMKGEMTAARVLELLTAGQEETEALEAARNQAAYALAMNDDAIESGQYP